MEGCRVGEWGVQVQKKGLVVKAIEGWILEEFLGWVLWEGQEATIAAAKNLFKAFGKAPRTESGSGEEDPGAE